MDSIKYLKVEIFDILQAQEGLRIQLQNLEKVKQLKLAELKREEDMQIAAKIGQA